VDPIDISPRRLCNIARSLITQALAWGEDEPREAFHQAMEWPEVAAVEAESAQDRSARHAAQLLGSSNVDEMILQTLAARQRQAAAEAGAAEDPPGVEEASP
jgi:hypothetical protein